MKMRDRVELLAPAGKWDVLVKVFEAGADAVYLGGKRFNMRLLRPDFNFSDSELKDAVKFAHDLGKRIYITVNNLYFENEIQELTDYLCFLGEIKPDALIVQDLAVAVLAREIGLGVPLHASVQMGIGSAEAARYLAEQGFKRVILSKNVSLQEIDAINMAHALELEYFVHGDVCISHTGQCFMSSFIFSQSANRGLCRKPCRWLYTAHGVADHPPGYYLAHKDLCLIEHLRELMEAGICSFKIEGRMREADYLALLVRSYRSALDRTLERDDYRPVDEYETLYRNRIRDFSKAGFAGRPTKADIGISGKREPPFPTSPRRLSPGCSVGLTRDKEEKKVEFQVIVDNFPAFSGAVQAGTDAVIIGEGFCQGGQIDLDKAREMAVAHGSTLVYQIPRIVTESEILSLEEKLSRLEGMGFKTVLVSDLGSLRLARQRGFEVWADFGLNITNRRAAAAVLSGYEGRITASLELDASQLLSWLKAEKSDVDVLVHGRLPGMVTDLCLRRLLNEPCSLEEGGQELFLVDELGQRYPVLCDQACRNHVFYPLELSLLGHVQELVAAGCSGLRLDLTGYHEEEVKRVLALYRQAIYAAPIDLARLVQELKSLPGHAYTDRGFGR